MFDAAVHIEDNGRLEVGMRAGGSSNRGGGYVVISGRRRGTTYNMPIKQNQVRQR